MNSLQEAKNLLIDFLKENDVYHIYMNTNDCSNNIPTPETLFEDAILRCGFSWMEYGFIKWSTLDSRFRIRVSSKPHLANLRLLTVLDVPIEKELCVEDAVIKILKKLGSYNTIRSWLSNRNTVTLLSVYKYLLIHDLKHKEFKNIRSHFRLPNTPLNAQHIYNNPNNV